MDHGSCETVWGLVQKYGKSNATFGLVERKLEPESPLEPKNIEDTGPESADLKQLIRKQWHISEHVSSTQIPPYSSAYKRAKAKRWSAGDTQRFYEAVENFGSDLLMVRAYLPEYSDRQVYEKFKLEERKNPQRLQAAILKKSHISIEQFEAKFGKIDEDQHYDPAKDPMLQHPPSPKLSLGIAPSELTDKNETVNEREPDLDPETQDGNGIMDLFM
ncbi:bifunctional Homeobox-like domain superfamily/Transcription factor TFIIIB component B'' [Babesia duncani]|uniref:Bifunctional Homeobox-like domain superfamily/Transcription factor TFIIIB component B n=1 Tax=Babesia duncani TaxID=323732 RepID=A0AAD9UNY4_9APIC|nr:bifunctional Homeobox-like domain superfamily/Transcription factor TFIIIB component B'' [Babesia duncani]